MPVLSSQPTEQSNMVFEDRLLLNADQFTIEMKVWNYKLLAA